MGEPVPRVSLCVPVRNGQKYLRACLDSLLAQTYTDFELIVCDNASTDATESICRQYASRDSRIRYHRHQTNLGPAANFNFGLHLARGEYFRWHAHDDLVAPEHLAECVDVLDRDHNRQVVVVYPQTTIIDERGEPVEQYQYVLNLDEPSPVTRFRRFMLAPHRQHRNFEVFGLMRREALLRTPGHEPYAHGDRVLIARLCLLGRLRQIPRPLFLARRHVSQSMQTLPSRASGGRSWVTRWLGPGPLPPPEWWNPALRHRVVFPDWNLVRQYWRSVSVAPLGWPQRLACRAALLLWLGRYWPKLVRDVAFAIETALTHAEQEEAENGSAVSMPAAATAAAPAAAAAAGVAAGTEASAGLGVASAASRGEPASVREVSARPLRG